MSKAEKFIRDCTRNCSNELITVESRAGKEVVSYHEWLTPDQARRAVEIAREEIIELFCEWVKKNVTYTHPRKETEECIVNISKLKEDLKQAIKDE